MNSSSVHKDAFSASWLFIVAWFFFFMVGIKSPNVRPSGDLLANVIGISAVLGVITSYGVYYFLELVHKDEWQQGNIIVFLVTSAVTYLVIEGGFFQPTNLLKLALVWALMLCSVSALLLGVVGFIAAINAVLRGKPLFSQNQENSFSYPHDNGADFASDFNFDYEAQDEFSRQFEQAEREDMKEKHETKQKDPPRQDNQDLTQTIKQAEQNLQESKDLQAVMNKHIAELKASYTQANGQKDKDEIQAEINEVIEKEKELSQLIELQEMEKDLATKMQLNHKMHPDDANLWTIVFCQTAYPNERIVAFRKIERREKQREYKEKSSARA